MNVIAHELHLWFLLEENGKYLFDINCERSFISYDFSMFLSEEEVSEYLKFGHVYLNTLAEKVNYSAPIIKGSTSQYKNRKVANEYSSEILDSITEWKRLNL